MITIILFRCVLINGRLSQEIELETIRVMATLNDKPVTAIREVGSVSALTDVTGSFIAHLAVAIATFPLMLLLALGFGLLGHLRKMAVGSGVDVEVWVDRIPVLKGAFEFAAAGVIPGGTKANLEYVSPCVEWDEGLGSVCKHLLVHSPQVT